MKKLLYRGYNIIMKPSQSGDISVHVKHRGNIVFGWKGEQSNTMWTDTVSIEDLPRLIVEAKLGIDLIIENIISANNAINQVIKNEG